MNKEIEALKSAASYRRWVEKVFRDRRLTKFDKSFLIALSVFANKKGQCYPARDAIASLMSVSVDTVTECTKRLVALGEIRVKRTHNGSNRYTIKRYILTEGKGGGSQPAGVEAASHSNLYKEEKSCPGGISRAAMDDFLARSKQPRGLSQ